ncbi:MAG: hypothetical protein KDI55_00295 [Anaerolineae bacterium]|nr:hypothetical protein [Anaerolineae bacterium]
MKGDSARDNEGTSALMSVLISLDEARAILGGISRASLHKILPDHGVSVIKVGAKPMLERAEVQRMLDEIVAYSRSPEAKANDERRKAKLSKMRKEAWAKRKAGAAVAAVPSDDEQTQDEQGRPRARGAKRVPRAAKPEKTASHVEQSAGEAGDYPAAEPETVSCDPSPVEEDQINDEWADEPSYYDEPRHGDEKLEF